MLILINILIQDMEFFQYWYWNWKYWNWDIEIEKNNFYLHKAPIFLKDVDIEKVLVPKKISFGEKNYKLSHYIQCFLKQELMLTVSMSKLNGCISWLKMKSTCDKVSADIKKEFDRSLSIIKIIWKPK